MAADGKILGYGRFEWIFSIIFALLVLLAVRACGSSDDGQSAIDKAEKRCFDSSWAWVMSQRYVKSNLRSPASAKFPALPNSAEHLSGCSHIVVGEVEAQNGFGVMVSHRFSAVMTYDKNSDTWAGSDLNLQ